MAPSKDAGDFNVASFFCLKLLYPKNGTPAVEKKTDKKGRPYLVLHVRDCAGKGTYVCTAFNTYGLADRILALNDGQGLLADEVFLATGRFYSYESDGAIKHSIRLTSLISYGCSPTFGFAGDGNDVLYSKLKVVPLNQTGEPMKRFSTRQGAAGVRFCLQETTENCARFTYSCIAFGHMAETILAQRLAVGDTVTARGSLYRLADGRDVFKISERLTVLSRSDTVFEKPLKNAFAIPYINTVSNIQSPGLGGRSFG